MWSASRGRSVSLQVLDREGLQLRLQLSGPVPETQSGSVRQTGGAVLYLPQVFNG